MDIKTLLDTVIGYYKVFKIAIRLIFSFKNKSSNSEKHLLILAWLFPPTISGGVYRPLSFAREAAKQGWQVTVVAGPAPHPITEAGRYLIESLPSTVRVVRINESTLRPSHNFFPRVDGGFLNAIETVDRCCEYAPSVILASGPPFHNFIVGWYLSRYFGRPLVLDYRDEWSDCPFDFVHKGNLDDFLEKKILQRATSVLFTTDSFQTQSHKSFSKIATEKFRIIANGYEKSDILSHPVGKSLNNKNNIFRITFLGALSGHSDPTKFLETLVELMEIRADLRAIIRIVFVGNRRSDINVSLSKHVLHRIIEVIDHVPKPEAMKLMCESDALLSLNPVELHRYIPGKLFDYVASGTPIIAYGDGGEVGRIIQRLHAGVITPGGDAVALGKAIDQARSWGTPDAHTERLRVQWLLEHERSHIAGRLLDHLEKLIHT